MSAASTSAETSARIRFVPKKIGEGRAAVWRVYDLQGGSFPYTTPELGRVLQDAAEAEILAECDRLTARFGGVNEKKRRAGQAKPTEATHEPDDEPDDEPASGSDA